MHTPILFDESACNGCNICVEVAQWTSWDQIRKRTGRRLFYMETNAAIAVRAGSGVPTIKGML